MRVLLISANTETISMTIIPVGLGVVATATTRAGHEVELLDLMMEKEPEMAIRNAISGFNPQIIGISVRNIDDQSMARPRFLLEKAKGTVAACRQNSSAPVVLGGAGYSIFPESALEYLSADMGIQGDGELAFIELMEHIGKGADLSDVPGLYLKGRGRQKEPAFAPDLDAAPIPAPELWASHKSAAQDLWMPFQTRRGCPNCCSFCSTHLIQGNATRKRSPEKAVAALADYIAAGFRRIFFTDNTFNTPYSYAMELSRLMVEKGLDFNWRCIIYPHRIDEPFVKLIAQAGCREVSLGFESGSENILHIMNKKFSPGEVRDLSKILADHGIRRMGFLLLGGPGETRETALKSLEFADSLNMDAMRVTAGIRIYPHTGLARRSVEEGVISAEDDLLFPKFYLVSGLGDWLQETIKKWASTRRSWII